MRTRQCRPTISEFPLPIPLPLSVACENSAAGGRGPFGPQGIDFKQLSMLNAHFLDGQTDFFPAVREG
jgi:hypothetical protein